VTDPAGGRAAASAAPLPEVVDLAVVGGGIHGAGLARDAAGRGLSVALLERDDLASATSSASSKLVHGGLRYLERFELRLVREALSERETLMANAPHLVRPLRFVMPHVPTLRPAWMIRLGLALYDTLGGRRSLERSRALALAAAPGAAPGAVPGAEPGAAPEAGPLRPEHTRGYVYSDCRTDDARLVVANARAAAGHGATVRTRTAVVSARREGGLWRVELSTGERLRARSLVNAAGPWALAVHAQVAGRPARHGVRLVQGSHLVVPRLYAADHAYILQQPDRRIVFVIPWEREFTLIGTTDHAVQHPDRPEATDAEIDYLLAAVGRFLREAPVRADIVRTFAGTRALYDDGRADPSKVTRSDVLELEHEQGRAPLLSIYGGKLTTYRRLAERALAKLLPFHPGAGPDWTAGAPLPGGALPGTPADGPDARFARLVGELTGELTGGLRGAHPALPPGLVEVLARRHGTDARALLAGAGAGGAALGACFGGALYEREVAWCVEHEWAREADDVLWRRTREGLRVDAAGRAALQRRLAAPLRAAP
jgi:glycerol-3-phosphate dehydrogenase